MIWIRTQSAVNGPYTETSLSIAPMDVEYPDFRNVKTQVTQDGAVVLQRPMRDGRPRRWVWRGYGLNDAQFAAQWAFLESLETRTRTTTGKPASVDIWEDLSGFAAFAKDVAGTRQYVTVRVVQVSRQPRKGGGPVVFESTVEFLIDDPAYAAF